jgi:hypothetical protein|eukprot:g1226.t1
MSGLVLQQYLEPLLRLVRDAPGSQRNRYRVKLAEVVSVLAGTAVLFCALEEDMKTFGYFVYVGLLYMIWSCEDMALSLLAGFITGSVGAFTEWWGCSNKLWNWVSANAVYPGDRQTASLFMIGGDRYGFPIEVVIAYAGAGFWMASISRVILEKEHAELAHGKGNVSSNALPYRVVSGILLLVAYFEPVCLQSCVLLWAGINMTLGLTDQAKIASISWGCLVGVSGFFFEIFATGGIADDFAVWRYDKQRHHEMVQSSGTFHLPVYFVSTAPHTAILAYVGTGLIIFSGTFQITRSTAKTA